MTDYPFDKQLAVAALDENAVIRDGEVWIYATTDTAGTTPLVLEDLKGLPLVNPLRSNAFGNTRPFVTTVPQVRWVSGIHDGLFNSYMGLFNEANAARLAAQEAQSAADESALQAAESSQLAVAPTAEQIDEALRRAALPSNLALDTDGIPYILAGANGVTVYTDTDGQPYFV